MGQLASSASWCGSSGSTSTAASATSSAPSTRRICDAGSRDKSSWRCGGHHVQPQLDHRLRRRAGLQLIEDTYAEWLRLGEVDRAADDEAAARQQQRGDTAGAWPGYTDAPYPPRERAADLAVGTTAGAARPRSEEERQVGNVRLNSDSSGLSPYSSSRDEEDIARRVHGVERRRGGCGSALASATRPATPRRGGRHRTLSASGAPRSWRSSPRRRKCRRPACGARRRRSPSCASTSTSCPSTSASGATNAGQRGGRAIRRLRCTWHPSRGHHSGRHRHHLAPLARCLGRLRLRRRPRSRHRPWRHQHRLGAGRC
jgi:hypothetical protein